MTTYRIGRNYGRCLAESITLVHWDPNGIKESLQLNIEQGTAADEEIELTSEYLTYFAEKDTIEQVKQWFFESLETLPFIIPLLIICISQAKSPVEQHFRYSTLFFYSFLYIFS